MDDTRLLETLRRSASTGEDHEAQLGRLKSDVAHENHVINLYITDITDNYR